MLINLSNHPCGKWGQEQQATAIQAWGEIEDYPFPAVAPQWDENRITQLADEIVSDIVTRHGNTSITVHVMGEFCLTHALVLRFKSHGITCVASTSQRMVKELSPGNKEVTFHFVRFRQYL
ncbi:hypothetical protein [Sodaliphilus sp.]|uniref:hypothetical protein n=1 Tax=Sodaliphilus sp. TaxID=2815818 RepID=UPI00388DE180